MKIHNSDLGLLLLRVALGVVFIVHGSGKVFGGVAGFSGMLDSVGVPAAMLFAWLVALIEFVGGIFIIIGLFTRWSAFSQSVVMLFAIILVHGVNGYSGKGGYESQLTLLLLGLGLFFLGGGKWSVDAKWLPKCA